LTSYPAENKITISILEAQAILLKVLFAEGIPYNSNIAM